MNNLNSVLIEGELTREPSSSWKTTADKTIAICKFRIHSTREYRTPEGLTSENSIFNVVTLGKQAEKCGEYLKKGAEVRIVGHLRSDPYTAIVAEHIEWPKVKVADEHGQEVHDAGRPEPTEKSSHSKPQQLVD